MARKTKAEKKRNLGILLLALAAVQVLNFATANPGVFPKFYLKMGSKSFLWILFTDLNWPFRIFNYYAYYLLGWTAYLTPLFFLALSLTLFNTKETASVKRKRIIYIWGFFQLSLLVYFVNFVSFFVVPKAVKAGKIADLFATYLSKVGGSFFVAAFVIYSTIAFILFLRKSTWPDFFSALKRFFSRSGGKIGSQIQSTFDAMGADRSSAKVKVQTKEVSASYQDKPKKKSKWFGKDKEGQAASGVDLQIKDTTAEKVNFNLAALAKTKKKSIPKKELEELSKKVDKTLVNVGLKLKKVGHTVGPRLVRFEYSIPSNSKFKEVERQQNELMTHLGDLEISVQVPIPGSNKIGISVGRKQADSIRLGSYLAKASSRKEKVPLFVGVAADGKECWNDASAYPHLLIAGTTGSGKSVFLNNLILNLMAISKKIPINLVLIDPKRVEFSPFAKAKQLAHSIITEVDDARGLLVEAENLMEARYSEIQKAKVRNIFDFNKKQKVGNRMPFLFIIVDEFADLIMQDKSNSIKESVIRLAQKSRAVGIHVVIATQRPSAKVIDGLIKANFPARIAFKTASKVDSRIILDENGAEELLGKGDMLAKTRGDDLERLQAAYVDIDEISKAI